MWLVSALSGTPTQRLVQQLPLLLHPAIPQSVSQWIARALRRLNVLSGAGLRSSLARASSSALQARAVPSVPRTLTGGVLCAGLRGPMGPGTSRMNDLTVIQATQVPPCDFRTVTPHVTRRANANGRVAGACGVLGGAVWRRRKGGGCGAWIRPPRAW